MIRRKTDPDTVDEDEIARARMPGLIKNGTMLAIPVALVASGFGFFGQKIITMGEVAAKQEEKCQHLTQMAAAAQALAQQLDRRLAGMEVVLMTLQNEMYRLRSNHGEAGSHADGTAGWPIQKESGMP